MKVTAKDIEELYIMSAILFNSVIYNIEYDQQKLTLRGSLKIDTTNFIGFITIDNIQNNIQKNTPKTLEFLQSITFNKNNQIEITTDKQLIQCPVSSINIFFEHDENMPS